ncbi:protein of unknown function [Stenotrophomonas maltophilia]|nr:protein of unknown function [Stenotrophomonas maltophilia]
MPVAAAGAVAAGAAEAASVGAVDLVVVAAGVAVVAAPVVAVLRGAGDDPTSMSARVFAVGTARVPARHIAGDHRGHRGR